MTTIAAVKKGKKVCLGCDGLTLFGHRKENSAQLAFEKDKILPFQKNYFACCGSAVWHPILLDYFKDLKVEYGFETVENIYLEMRKLHVQLKEKYSLTPQQNKQDLFVSSEHLLLLINSKGIFEVDWMRNVRQFAQMAAIGTGDEYALGAMRAIYARERDPEIIVKKGLEAAAKFDQKTELPLFYYCLDAE